jgi:hypothetical protein
MDFDRARTATLTEAIDPDGNVIDTTVEEGEKLLHGDAYAAALDDYLTDAVKHAQNGLTGRRLGIECSRKVRELTPGYESVVLEKYDDPRGLGHTPCEDGLHSHLGFTAPTACAWSPTRTPPPTRPLTRPRRPASSTPAPTGTASAT